MTPAARTHRGGLPGPAPRATGPGRRWVARCGVVAVVASGAGLVPVVGASAASAPVTPTSQVLDVPVVEEAAPAPSSAPSTTAPSSTPSATPSATPSRTPSSTPSTPAAKPSSGPSSAPASPAVPGGEPSEELATGPVRTEDFNMVSVQWDGDAEADVSVQVRVRTDDGWTGWQPLEAEDSAPDPGTAEARGANAGGATSPLWVSGGADAVDVRVQVAGETETPDGGTAPSDVSGVRASLIDPKTEASARTAGTPLATASATTRDMPGVITRSQWGADESLRLSKCAAPSYTTTPKVAFVHHTAGTNTYTRAESAAIVRGIYYQHVVVQGWCDIGYNFLVDKYGQVFEGRFGGMDRAVQGAHAGGFNTASFGVSVLGNYQTAPATPTILDALARVISWKFAQAQTDPTGRAVLYSAGVGGTNTKYPVGTPVTLNTISGHRDVGSTACPGANLYSQLPSLRTRVAQLMAEKEWDLRQSATPGAPDGTAYFGEPRGTALSCDWDGDGTDGLAVYSGGRWSLRQSAGNDDPDLELSYGSPSMLPVCGDWTGSGKDGIGVYDPATYTWWLRDTASPGAPDHKFTYGFKGVRPVVGDWDGRGRSGIGVYDGYRWWLRGTAAPGPAGAVFSYGWPQATPVTGDWDGDGRDTVGVYATGAWWLRNSITPGQPDALFGYGAATDQPVVGRWDTSALVSSGATTSGTGDSGSGGSESSAGDAATSSQGSRGDGVGVWRSWP